MHKNNVQLIPFRMFSVGPSINPYGWASNSIESHIAASPFQKLREKNIAYRYSVSFVWYGWPTMHSRSSFSRSQYTRTKTWSWILKKS